MTSQQDAIPLGSSRADRVPRGTQAMALLALGLGPLLLAAWQLKPLYADNQNTKFLHALADTGAGFLREDWLARTKDGLPLFTRLLEAMLRTVGPNGFYAAAAITYIIFLFCALLIYQRIAKGRQIPAHGLPVFLGLMFVIAMLTDVQQVVLAGFSEQYILGGYFQTADFGVFLIGAVVLFERRLLTPAIACILLAAAMHPGYVAPGAVLTVIVLLYELTQEADQKSGAKFTALVVSAIGLIVLATMAYALKQLFAATDPQSQLEAAHVLTAVRIPRHADPWVWFNQNVIAQFALCLAAALLLSAGRLRFVLRLGLGALVVFTAIAFLPGTETYRLIAPWRISVVLVPLATIALCALVAARLDDAGIFRPDRLRLFTLGGAGVVLFCAAVGTGFSAVKFRKAEPAFRDYVRANLAPGQQYLTPPSLHDFRLATGVPQYVTFKSHPYQDIEVLEWHKRLRVAQELYASARIDCERLQHLVVEERLTHMLVTGKAPVVACGFAAKVFDDGGAKIYRLERTKLAGANLRH